MRASPNSARAYAGVSFAALAALTLSSAGCRSCKNEHPYVPFSIDGSPGANADDGAAADPVEAVVDGGAKINEPADVAPPTTTKWALGGIELNAPSGYLFALGLVRDFDGDGKLDAFAILFPAEGRALGQAVYYRGETGPKGNTVAAPIVIVTSSDPVDGSCSPVPRLARVGHRSVEVELAAKCTGHTKPPSRVFAVLAAPNPALGDGAGATARVRFSAKIADPSGTPNLRVDADGADRDGDGIEDVALTLTLDGGSSPFEPGPKISAVLRWFDRPAGLSPDPDEPEASLRELAASAGRKAVRAKDASLVAGYIRQIRFLYAAFCGDGRTPRLQPTVGTGQVTCSGSRALEEAGYADAHAYVTMGDALRAAVAIDHASQPPASRTPARVNDALGWLKNVAPISEANQVRAVSAVPSLSPSSRGPAWGALAFEPSGKLLVRTASQIVRVDPAAGDEGEAPDVQMWKWQAIAPLASDVRWSDTVASCDATAAHAGFVSADEPIDLPLPLGPFLAARCVNGRGEALASRPIAWGTQGLEAFVAGEPILVTPDLTHAAPLAAPLEQPAPHGSPRSPSGKATVIPTSFGLIVGIAGAKGRLLVAKELEGSYGELRDCTVSDDATRVACVRGNRVAVGVWPSPLN